MSLILISVHNTTMVCSKQMGAKGGKIALGFWSISMLNTLIYDIVRSEQQQPERVNL